MRIDRDTFREILDSITRNRSRSLLTGFGVFWGIFMLMLLSGGSQGLKELLEKNFEGFAQNTCIAVANNTTKPYKGFQKGRTWSLDYSDVDRLRNLIPQIEVVSPIVSMWGRIAEHGENSFSDGSIKGVRSDYRFIETPKIRYGRYINDMDVNQGRKVCVIGRRVYQALFPEGGDPSGKLIRMDGVYYQVVGVDYNEGAVSINGEASDAITVPISVAQQAYNMGNQVHLVCFTAKEGVAMSDILPRAKEVILRNHAIDPTDGEALEMVNTQLIFGIVDNLFRGINFLVWLIGLGTLLAGAIGVSNIMMVAVRERTVEIGIRRAIGATPQMILGQILSESVLLTLGAGLLGIVFSVLVLSAVEMGMTSEGILRAHFQVQFQIALAAALLLSALGALAGLAPALRAMRIKPVDAMRDE